MPGRRAFVFLLLLVPPLLLLVFALTYAVNGPEWDHLSSAEIFDRWSRPGGLTMEFLFSQHNEHRKAAARLATLALGLLTGWNNRAEAVAHWALMCATSIVVFVAFQRELRPHRPRQEALLLFVPIGALLVSPRSYEALLGDGFPHYLSILALVAAIALLVNGRGWSTLAAAVTCGIIASFSISNGLLIWPLGIAILASTLRGPADQRARPAKIAVWTAIGTATIALYFNGYVDPGNHSPPGFVVEHPLRAASHLLAVSGSSLAPYSYAAVAVGAVVLALQGWCLAGVGRDWWVRRETPPLSVWLMAMVVPSVAMITLNRAEFGLPQAMESRYTALSVLAPIAIYWCVLARQREWQPPRWLLRGVTVLLAAGYLAATAHAWAIAPSWHSRKSWQAYLVYSAKFQPLSILENVYPNPRHGAGHAAIMERLGLSVFAEPHVQPETLRAGLRRPDYRVDVLNHQRPYTEQPLTMSAGDPIEISGWAFNEDGTGPARAIFINVDGTRDLPGHPGIYRDALGGPVRGRGRRWAGFVASFDAAILSPGEHTLALKIVSDDGTRFFLSGPIGRVVRQ